MIFEKSLHKIQFTYLNEKEALILFAAIINKDQTHFLVEEILKKKPVLSIYLNFGSETELN